MNENEGPTLASSANRIIVNQTTIVEIVQKWIEETTEPGVEAREVIDVDVIACRGEVCFAIMLDPLPEPEPEYPEPEPPADAEPEAEGEAQVVEERGAP